MERRKKTALHDDKLQHFAEWACKRNKTSGKYAVCPCSRKHAIQSKSSVSGIVFCTEIM